MQKGVITIEIENISLVETERYQNILHTIITQGALNILNGSANLHYREGELDSIDLNIYTYKRSKLNNTLQPVKNMSKTIVGLRDTTNVL
jgi:hypothetical protein